MRSNALTPWQLNPTCADLPVTWTRSEIAPRFARSEEHTSDSSHSQISYAVFCLKKKKKNALRMFEVHAAEKNVERSRVENVSAACVIADDEPMPSALTSLIVTIRRVSDVRRHKS